MLDLEDRLAELNQLGLHQRMRMVSGPQGPRVVLDGRPVLLLCSGNALGLADHPRVRQAAADAAMRWGVGAGAARVSSGTMTLHRRLEERLATFTRQRGVTAVRMRGRWRTWGVIPALARRGEVVLARRAGRTARSSTAAGSRAPTWSPTATATPSTSRGRCASATGAPR